MLSSRRSCPRSGYAVDSRRRRDSVPRGTRCRRRGQRRHSLTSSSVPEVQEGISDGTASVLERQSTGQAIAVARDSVAVSRRDAPVSRTPGGGSSPRAAPPIACRRGFQQTGRLGRRVRRERTRTHRGRRRPSRAVESRISDVDLPAAVSAGWSSARGADAPVQAYRPCATPKRLLSCPCQGWKSCGCHTPVERRRDRCDDQEREA